MFTATYDTIRIIIVSVFIGKNSVTTIRTRRDGSSVKTTSQQVIIAERTVRLTMRATTHKPTVRPVKRNGTCILRRNQDHRTDLIFRLREAYRMRTSNRRARVIYRRLKTIRHRSRTIAHTRAKTISHRAQAIIIRRQRQTTTTTTIDPHRPALIARVLSRSRCRNGHRKRANSTGSSTGN